MNLLRLGGVNEKVKLQVNVTGDMICPLSLSPTFSLGKILLLDAEKFHDVVFHAQNCQLEVLRFDPGFLLRTLLELIVLFSCLGLKKCRIDTSIY